MNRRLLAACAFAALALSAAAPASTAQTSTPSARPPGLPAHADAVRAAVVDYVEGFYQGDTTRLVRSVRPDVFKYGYARHRDSTAYRGMQMTWPQFHAYANGVSQRGRQAPASAPREIVLLDVLDQTAAAKLTAWWGTDYLLLAREGDRWMITHVLWQSPPPAR